MQLGNEVYEYIRQMIDEESSRLEIVESCISEFGDDYPDYEYDDWSKIVKSLMPKEDDEEVDIFIPIPSRVNSIGNLYKNVIEKLRGLIDWAETSPVPLEKWSISGVSKWSKSYKECLESCKCLELDYFEQNIEESLYNEISTALSQVEEYTARLPKVKAIDTSYLDSSISVNVARRRKIKVPDYYSRKDKYLTLISSIPPTTNYERKKLIKRYHEGDKAALDAIIESFLPMIYNMALQFHEIYPNIDIQDFVGEGACVLASEFAKYEEKYGRMALGYTMGSVKNRMAMFAAESNLLIHLPLNIETYRRELLQNIDTFEQCNERKPTAEEIAEIMDISIDKVVHLLKFSFESLGDCIELYEEEDESLPVKILTWESLCFEVNRALMTLTPREADILRKSFGIGTKEKTCEEIGDELHLTRERVRQIMVKAVRKLNSGQRSHILQTYLGVDLLSMEEIDLYEKDYYGKTNQTDKQPYVIETDPEENKRIDDLYKRIAESRRIIKSLKQWVDARAMSPVFSMEEVQDWKRLNGRLDENIAILENETMVSPKTMEELRTNIQYIRSKSTLTSILSDSKPVKRTKVPVESEEDIPRGNPSMSSVDIAFDTYKKYFKSLKRSNRNGELAPHKIILLLSILALYKDPSQQKTVLIKMTPELEEIFERYWNWYVKSPIWKKDISMPWKHMVNEPFWHECKDPSKGCYIDAELKTLLVDTGYRASLREILKEQLVTK